MLPGSTRRFTAKQHVLLVALIIVAPLLVFSTILVASLALEQRARVENGIQEKARALALAVDQELSGIEYTLVALTNAPVIQSGNLEALHDYLVAVAHKRDAVITLRDHQSRQIVNSSVPWGNPLPTTTALRDVDLKAGSTGRTVVSNWFMGIQVKRPSFAVVTPIMREGVAAYFMSLSSSTNAIADVLTKIGLEGSEIALVVDENGIVIARSKENQNFSGSKVRNNMFGRAEGDYGRLVSENIDGVEIATFFARSKLSNWMVGVSVPLSELRSPVYRSLRIVAFAGVILSALSLVAALFLAHRFSSPIRALAESANDLGSGRPIEIQRTSVEEIHQVWESMKRSSLELEVRTKERDRAEEETRKLNETLEQQVLSRTAELSDTNTRLRNEIQTRQESEERVRQLQKVEAVGQLTGGIAHDFNNMLAAILGGLRLIERKVGRGEYDIGALIEGATESANRAAQLTRRLLAFSRQQALSPRPLDANKLIAGMSELLKRTLPEVVSVETVLAAGLWRVHADANQLENAVLNLAVNARDAMPEGGKLTIETSNSYLDAAYAAEHAEVHEGQYVMVAITDTGSGMSPETLSRAFDPFFSTKPEGKGTGLGLSQVHGFLKQSGGHVKIYSEPGQGTTVKLYLPRFLGQDQVPLEPTSSSALPVASGNETILVVEDDDRVRATTVALVRELGYRVLEADGAVAALRIVDANEELSLLFTDVVMPDINGRKLADAVRERRPDLPILFTTGYTRNAIVHNGVLDPGVHLLIKPFTLETLAQKLSDVLAGIRRV